MVHLSDVQLAGVRGGEATAPEKWVMDGVDWLISKGDSTWNQKDCAGRFGYLGWGYGYSTGIATTLLIAGGRKKVGALVGGVTSFYGARLNSNYVDNCKAKQAAASK